LTTNLEKRLLKLIYREGQEINKGKANSLDRRKKERKKKKKRI